MDKLMKKFSAIVRSKKFWIVFIAVFMIIVTAIVCSQLLGEGGRNRKKKGYEVIQSQYVDWFVPSEIMPFLKHETEVNGAVVSDLFYMQTGAEEVPVFRFDFGDENAGDWLGLLTVDDEKIPVVYTVFVLSDEELSAIDETAAERYYALVDAFNEMVQDLNENPDFSSERLLEVGEDRQVGMVYWDVTLPSKMDVHETNEDGNYEAIFSGEVVGEMVILYRVCIGEGKQGVFQGYFEVDGKKQPVFVESYEVAERASWDEKDYATAYRMMDTVNDVLQKIRTSKYYSAK